MKYPRRFSASLLSADSTSSGDLPWVIPGGPLGSYRNGLLLIAILCFLAHALVLASLGPRTPGPLLSEIFQFVLGVTAFLAMVDASRRSSRFAQRVWTLSAVAIGAYTAGQGIMVYYVARTVSDASYRLTTEIFFFWFVPLLIAAVIDPSGLAEIFNWDLVLDLGQFLILALALHLLFMGNSLEWQTRFRETDLRDWETRIARDLVVLSVLAGRAFFSRFPQVRALFLRLGIFYLSYSLVGGIYKYAEAIQRPTSGTWLDLGWSVPRLLAVIVAITWMRTDDIAAVEPSPRRRYRLLHFPPILIPLAVLIIGSRMLSTNPVAASFLVVASFAVAGTRLLVAQFRQDRTLDDLRRSSDLLHSVVEGTSEAVFLKDVKGRYLLINSAGARYIGRTVDEVLGKTDQELFSSEVAEAILNRDREVISHGQAVTGEEVITAAGIKRTFLSTRNLLRDSDGRIQGVLGISMDITERRRMEDHLRRAQRMESIGTFSGAIAHDFNNLLTVIKGYSQLILSGVDAQLQANVEQIDKASDRAASLTRQLLAFSRQQILQPRVISLNDIISNLQTMLRRLIGEDVEIATHLSPDLWSVKADPGQIEQVLMNLAANARDAMPDGGRLTLETHNVQLDQAYARTHADAKPGPYVMFAVSDTGMGMDQETQAHIFEPFFTTKPLGKGTGLGLATVYGIIKQSGGYIWHYSEPGSGTTFKIYLPRVEQPVEYVTLPMSLPSARRGHEIVLLVEDDVQLRDLTRSILSGAGYKVLTADGAEQAQTTAGRHHGPIHLLLTDVVMPGTSGREVARRICGKRSETRVLYMSGYTGDAIVHHGVLDAGISFLQKPFTPATLMQRVREVLDASAKHT